MSRIGLNAERGSAPAGALDVGIFEFESRTLERFNIVDHAAVEVHHGRGVNVNLQTVHIEGLVHHSGAVLELHGIRESGAPATHNTDAQAGWNGVLLSHDLFH